MDTSFTSAFLLFLALVSVRLHSTNYYINNISGNDNNNGLTPSTAWQTLNKVNTASFSPGDSVLFICGGSWRGQLQPKSGNTSGSIIYASYGIGSKPTLLGSVSMSTLSDWVNLGGNIWQSLQTFTVDIGNIILSNGLSCGIKKWSASNMVSQGDFWYDKTGTQKVEMYSVGNPATFYSDIEAALGDFIVYLSADSFVVIQNMAFKYGSADGIEIRNTHHAIIKDCEVSYIGGTELTPQVRYGGGIQFWAKSHDNRVERCKIWEIYDDAITNQGNSTAGGTIQQYNLNFVNNLIWNCSESSYCFFIQPATVSGSYLKNIHFENNTCVNAGGGWAASQRPDLKGFQIYCSTNTALTDSIFIRNNIFYKSRCFLFIDNTSVHTWSFTISDYNCWYTERTSDTIAAFWTSAALNIFTEPQFSLYQTTTNQDAHSFMADPLLLSPSTANFYLTAISPCINTGTNTGVATDFNLTPRPQGGNYDIGAYEYVNTLSLQELSSINESIRVYPNPSSSYFIMDSHNDNIQKWSIYDTSGRLVFSSEICGKVYVDTDTFREGVYHICLLMNGSIINRKICIIK